MEKMTKNPLEIKWVDVKKDEDMEDAFYIRREVFIKEQNVPEEEEFDEEDLRSHHVVVYSDGRPVATGRLFKTEENWFIGRISVLKDFRGKQLGKLVVEKLLERAAEIEAMDVHIHAQTHAVNFYEKFGFITYGDTFLEAGIEHISMAKRSEV
ncbi:Acetyltransferase [bioreactor metagenome]|uniref:Acetyltransferase n=1 Tax=bioreactor metagenome TaxID=1076179 RepID=A0A645E6K9_9ZZZZ